MKRKLERKKRELQSLKEKDRRGPLLPSSSSSPEPPAAAETPPVPGGGGGRREPPPLAVKANPFSVGTAANLNPSLSLPPLPSPSPSPSLSLFSPPPAVEREEGGGREDLAEKNRERFKRTSEVSGDRTGVPDSAATSSTAPPPAFAGPLKNALSLRGACLTMCPESEILSRDRMAEMKTFERPHPSVHPPSWTLKDTAIKRFQSSSAGHKLDDPEHVRPPHVLEVTVSYLEEWVLDRDRQGFDPRFKGVPESLDLYQFVWGCTRMIRKDFTLQNFSSALSGLNSASAVRTHERIARWHLLSEHQLWHIPDYRARQSTQNVAELMKALKSLNEFYDDPRKRGRVEGEGSGSGVGVHGVHGVKAGSVQGPTPVDYTGTPLTSPPTPTLKIGNPKAPHAATDERNMRALYMLMTMDNDGGMEVAKLAKRLDDDVFDSGPVQVSGRQ